MPDNSHKHLDIVPNIVKKAKDYGASLAGIAGVSALQISPSYQVYRQLPFDELYEQVGWPAEAKSVLVWAVVHDKSDPELDWWDYEAGGTPGNRKLISQANSLKQWLNEDFNIKATPLPYKIEKGGVFLKDAAALAGLGIVGKNNLLLTPEYGPHIRLRAMFLDVDLEPTIPTEFNPCQTCDMPCMRACPQNAFRTGFYSRALCNVQMKHNEANEVVIEESKYGNAPRRVIQYCRACELACPVAG